MKPTVLVVTEIQPYPLYGGMYIHIYNTMESLSQHAEVIMLCPRVSERSPLHERITDWYELPDYDISLRSKLTNGRYVLQMRPSWQRCLQEILEKHKPQVVWFLYGHWGQYAPLAQQFGACAVMHTQNIQSEITRQRATTTPFGLLRLLTQFRTWAETYHERHLFRQCDRIVSLTEIDRQYHARYSSHECNVLIPGYIHDALYQAGHAIERADDLLILTGSFGSFQNVQAVRWILDKVWPLVKAEMPTVRLQLVGRGASQLPKEILHDAQLKVVDSVPDMVPYLRSATIAVVPILHGSGIRFKILEAFACDIPVVSTTLGAQGINAVHGESIMLADTPAEFAQSLISLLADERKRDEMAQAGRAVLEREYTTAINTERIRELVEQLCRQPIERELFASR